MERKKNGLRRCFAAAVLAMVAGGTPLALAEEMMQLNVPAEEYTLGRFKYKAPKADGWRQMANIKQSLSLVYAQEPEPGKIETIFGVAMEAHDIPPGTNVENAAALAALSANQMSEARKADLVARSPVEAVPTIDGMYTYRLLVHPPVKDKPDSYEVYYVMLSPDKTQYLVAQAITKEQEYGDKIYFTEFYGSLASIKYDANAAKPGEPAAGAAPPAAAPAPDAAKPATEAPKHDHDDHAGHNH